MHDYSVKEIANKYLEIYVYTLFVFVITEILLRGSRVSL
mgnify:CR=1 FL=1